MSLTLLVFRHSHAQNQHPQGDRYRPLSDWGFGRLRTLSGMVQSRDPRCQVALSSPYTRARQTCLGLAESLGNPRIVETPVLIPSSDADDVQNEVRQLHDQGFERLALVSHNPLVTDLVARWTGFEVAFDSPTGVAIVFDHGVEWGEGRLLWTLCP